ELNSGSPVATSTYSPASWLFQYWLRKGGSVAARWVTSYWIGVSDFRSCSSDGFLYVVLDMTGLSDAARRPSDAALVAQAVYPKTTDRPPTTTSGERSALANSDGSEAILPVSFIAALRD